MICGETLNVVVYVTLIHYVVIFCTIYSSEELLNLSALYLLIYHMACICVNTGVYKIN